jgi:hypothetical protein
LLAMHRPRGGVEFWIIGSGELNVIVVRSGE